MLQNAWLSEIKSKIAVAKENDPFVIDPIGPMVRGYVSFRERVKVVY